MSSKATESVRSLVASGRLREALALLQGLAKADLALADEATALVAQYAELERADRRDELAVDELMRLKKRLAQRGLALLRELDSGMAAGPASASPPISPPVAPPPALPATPPVAASLQAQPAPARAGTLFISYNHADAQAAQALMGALQAAGMRVIIDSETMAPGGDIGGFVRRSVASSRATLCLVSERSLLSGWVAQETLLALASDELHASGASMREFIALWLDDGFLAPQARLKLTETIDARLAELQGLRRRQEDLQLDTVDLDSDLARLHALRHGLGRILQRLRGTLALDWREAARGASQARLLAHLAAPPEGANG